MGGTEWAPCLWVWAAAKTARRPVTIDDLAERVGWHSYTVMPLVKRLVRHGLLRAEGTGLFLPTRRNVQAAPGRAREPRRCRPVWQAGARAGRPGRRVRRDGAGGTADDPGA
jgi:hypothetical protein